MISDHSIFSTKAWQNDSGVCRMSDLEDHSGQ